jgi:hypothetical protein
MCPYYLDGDLRWSATESRPTGDTRQSGPMSWAQLLMQPREESVRGCVATVQFSRAVREGVRVIGAMGAPASCAGLSKLNSMQRARAQRYAELARSGLVDVPGRSGVADRVGPATTKVAGARGAFPIGFHYGTP